MCAIHLTYVYKNICAIHLIVAHMSLHEYVRNAFGVCAAHSSYNGAKTAQHINAHIEYTPNIRAMRLTCAQCIHSNICAIHLTCDVYKNIYVQYI